MRDETTAIDRPPEKTKQELDDAYVQDTTQHIELVRRGMMNVMKDLKERGESHDASKFEEPERSIFAAGTARRDAVVYGSPEYYEHMKTVNIALEHHYSNNRHHPEWHERGMASMNLIDMIEMLCDWTAASMKSETGDPRIVHKAIQVNQERFGYSDELAGIFHNTIEYIFREREAETESPSGDAE